MQAGESKATKSAMTDAAGKRMPASSSLRRVVGVALVVTVLVISAVGFGFIRFVEQLPRGEPVLEGDADGIVVLTGRASRISDAIELLATKRGKRLLISGVYPTTSAAAIARLVPEHQNLFSCCVELDYSAVNTSGNAVQTRIWARKHNIKSLIVVTSNYHMPRAMVEISHELPDVALISYSIPPERVRIESWWESYATTRLLFAEYLKYLRAQVRTQMSALSGGSRRA
jgi:uncharacterized SAM-binding protein YcdF (DUF218 family)